MLSAPSAAYQTFAYMLRPAAYIAGRRRREGDVFTIRTLNLRGVGVCTPALAKEVFATDPDAFDSFATGLQGIFGPRSLFSTAGATHKQQRKLLNPRFHGAHVRGFSETMRDVARKHFAAQRPDRVVAMNDVGQAISLDVILETVFGGGGGVDLAAARKVLGEMLQGFSPLAVFSRVVRTRLFPPWRRFVDSRDAFYALVSDAIRARRAAPEPGTDILGLLVAARYDDGSAMTDGEIRDHLLTLLVAGHETTAISIAWGVHWLLRDRRALAKLREELHSLWPNPPCWSLLKAPYLGAVCDETLRIRPIVTDVVRPLLRPVRIGGRDVPAGQSIVVLLQAILTDPVVFPEPERFRPERFLEQRYAASEFLPFGGGHRRCLGAAFAENELRLVLGTLVTEWDLELTSSEPERAVRRNVTMGPERGVPVRFLGARV